MCFAPSCQLCYSGFVSIHDGSWVNEVFCCASKENIGNHNISHNSLLLEAMEAVVVEAKKHEACCRKSDEGGAS